MLTTVTGISGSGKSSLVSQALVELVGEALGATAPVEEQEDAEAALEDRPASPTEGQIVGGRIESIKRLIEVDQSRSAAPRARTSPPIRGCSTTSAPCSRAPPRRGRGVTTPADSRSMSPGPPSRCEGEGFVMVELLFLPSVYAPCPTRHGTRYNPQTLEIVYRGKTIADVLALTVEGAWDFFADAPNVR